MSADLVAAFAAWGALVFVAVFAVLVAVAVR